MAEALHPFTNSIGLPTIGRNEQRKVNENEKFKFDLEKSRRRYETFASREDWLISKVFFKDEYDCLKDELSCIGFMYDKVKDETVCETCGYVLDLKTGESPAVKHWLDQPKCGTLNYFKHLAPRHTESLTLDSRLKTFAKWPIAMKQTGKQMAEAGFVYLGNGDRVRCFCCGGVLKDWETEDNPWVEHARWIPSCQFLIIQKGYKFIEKIHEDLKNSEKIADNPNTVETMEIDNDDNENGFFDCFICYSESKLVCFEPCGHAGLCGSCSFTTNVCPLCKTDVKGRIAMVF